MSSIISGHMMGLPLGLRRKLQVILNPTARLVVKVEKYYYITPILPSLYWLPVCFHARLKVFDPTYKALNGLEPSYLSKYALPSATACLTRSSLTIHLQIWTHQEVKKTTTRSQDFSVMAPSWWNVLLQQLRRAPSVHVFKKQLKTELFIWNLWRDSPQLLEYLEEEKGFSFVVKQFLATYHFKSPIF